MADSDVKFTVIADTREAKGELSDLEKAAERVQSAANRGGGGGGGGGNPPRPGNPREEGEAFGKSAGRQIGKLVAGYMMHEATGIMFTEMRRRGMASEGTLDVAQGAVQGALRYGTMGAMFGPWGALIGAGVGAATGGFGAWQENQIKEEERRKLEMEDRRRRITALNDDERATNFGLAQWTEATAASKIIQMAPKGEDRLNTIQEFQNRAALEVFQLRKNMAMMIANGDKGDSELFKAQLAQYNGKQAFLRSLNRMSVEETMSMAEALKPSAPNIALDAYAKQGLYAGAMVPAESGTENIEQGIADVVGILRQILDASRLNGTNVNTINAAGAKALMATYGD